LTLQNSHQFTFGGAVTTGTEISISKSVLGNGSTFEGNVSTATLTVTSGPYSMAFFGAANSVTNAVNFLNTETLRLSNATSEWNFGNGFTATTQNGLTFGGTINSGGPINIGGNTTSIVLTGTTTINTSSNNSDITFGARFRGGVSGGTNSVTINAGTGTVSFGSTVSSMVNIAITANELNIAANDLVTGANFAGTGTLSITPGTSTRAIHLGGANNSNTSALNITASELAFLLRLNIKYTGTPKAIINKPIPQLKVLYTNKSTQIKVVNIIYNAGITG
jgi:hypothetical protein